MVRRRKGKNPSGLASAHGLRCRARAGNVPGPTRLVEVDPLSHRFEAGGNLGHGRDGTRSSVRWWDSGIGGGDSLGSRTHR